MCVFKAPCYSHVLPAGVSFLPQLLLPFRFGERAKSTVGGQAWHLWTYQGLHLSTA